MTKRDRLMVLTVLAVVLVGGFWFLILSPQRKAASAAEAQLGTATVALEAATPSAATAPRSSSSGASCLRATTSRRS
jgi:type II secretory pathway component PulM